MGSVLEDICNIIQIILTAFLVFFLLLKSRRVKEKTILYFMAGGVFCEFLGNVFWTFYHLIYTNTYPAYVSACDAAWLGGYLFLTTILFLSRGEKIEQKHPWWTYLLSIIVIVSMLHWIIVTKNLFVNIVWGIVMLMLSWYDMEAIWYAQIKKEKRYNPFYFSIFFFLLVEICLFSSSGMVYSVMNVFLTVALLIMPLTLIKGVE